MAEIIFFVLFFVWGLGGGGGGGGGKKLKKKSFQSALILPPGRSTGNKLFLRVALFQEFKNLGMFYTRKQYVRLIQAKKSVGILSKVKG